MGPLGFACVTWLLKQALYLGLFSVQGPKPNYMKRYRVDVGEGMRGMADGERPVAKSRLTCSTEEVVSLKINEKGRSWKHLHTSKPEPRKKQRLFLNKGNMNLFRLAGDMTHLLSILVLFLKIHSTKSCAGISLKTQELYALVFLTRYMDLIVKYYSLYNTLFKLIFIGTSFATVWYMRYHKVVKRTYNKDQDTFRHYYLILVCLVLAVLIPHGFTVTQVLWTFSIYLEAVAILPQLVLLQSSRNIDNLTGNYVFLLGTYRALYLLNWIYRFFTELHRVRWIPWISGLIQTVLYADFFYYYVKSWKKHEELKLPA